MRTNEHNFHNIEEEIKHVAVYLRLSRGEDESELDNHKTRLLNRCELNNWSYELYKEIGSGSTIDDRPVMQKLLTDVEKNLYDAVLVVDLDRLSRGNGTDNDRILYSMKVSETLIVVESPYQVLDANNESDEEIILFKGFFARFEFKQINKRMREGKKLAQSRGQWVNSITPYGYIVNKTTKKLTPSEEEAKVVIMIKDFFFEGKSTSDIAWELNKRKIKPRRATEWRSSSIANILQNEVYVGNIVYNKSVGNKKPSKSKTRVTTPYRRLPEEEWRRVYNAHQPLYSKEEFDRIKQYFECNVKSHKGSEVRTYALTGLCKTPDGKTMRVTQGKKGTDDDLYLFPKKNKHGDSSIYKGISYNVVYETLKEVILQVKDYLDSVLDQNENKDLVEELKEELMKKEDELETIQKAKNRIVQGFLIGLYDEQDSIELKVEKEKEIDEKEKEIEAIKMKIDNAKTVNNSIKKTKIERLLSDVQSAESEKEINRFYKTLIKEIIVDRTDENEAKIKVNFL